MTLVDPFVPVKNAPDRPRALPGLTNNIPRPQARAPQARLRPQQQQQPRSQPQAQIQQRPQQRAAGARPAQAPARRRRRFALFTKSQLKLLLLGGALLAVGLMLQSLVFGQLAILAYAAYALIRRVPSYTTLTLAGILIMGIIVLMVFNSFSPLISTFSVYAFLLITVGIISLVREIYGQDREARRA